MGPGSPQPSSPSAVFDQRLPIVLAVTGHRDPVEAPDGVLRRAIESILEDLDRLAPRTPIVALSPLAEGADRIFAEACLGFRGRRRHWPVAHDSRGGISLLAVLPMEQAEYEHDFIGPGVLEEFHRLVARADRCFPISMPEGGTVADLSREREHDPEWRHRPLRDEQYIRLGHFIAMQANLVIAMWDGRDEAKPGGTRAVVGFCARGRIERHTIPFRAAVKLLEPDDPTPVAWVPTGRRRHDDSPEVPMEGPAPDADLATRTSACWAKLGDGHASDPPPRSWNKLGDDLRWLDRLNGHLAAAGPGYEPSGSATPLDARFRRLDDAAVRAKNRLLRTLRGFIGLVAVTILALQATTAWSWWVWPLIYLCGLFVVWIGFRMIKWGRFEKRSADLRLLAEALRVQRHWLQAGIVEQASDHYFAHRAVEIPVLRRIMRGATLEAFDHNGGEGPTPVVEAWIEDQRDWIEKTIGRIERRKRRSRWILRCTCGLVVVLAGTSLWIALEDAASPAMFAWIDFLCGGTLTISLAVGLWQQVRGDEEDLRRYRSMRTIFRDALDRAREPSVDDAGLRDLLRAVGKEALDEQAAWHALHRETLDELPVG
jgi:hypothetical protein